MLSPTSIAPYFVIMLLLLGVGAVLGRWVPFYHNLVRPNHGARYETLDGLRGFLALGVFFSHGVTHYFYLRERLWTPSSRFYALLGNVAVLFFFFITGFLFWMKAINGNGRVAPIALYKARFRRLAPMYFCSTLLVIAIAACLMHFHLYSSLRNLVEESIRACSLGLLGFRSFNGVGTRPINGAVTWTLRYEWLFYLALPAIAFLARPVRFGFLVSALIVWRVAANWLPHLSPFVSGVFLQFVGGMLAAHIVHHLPPPARPPRWLSIVPVTCLICIMAGFKGQYLFSVIAFLCFVYGDDLFGLLTAPGAKVLGAISYSIYLLHPIVLYLVLHTLNRFLPVGALSGDLYWLLVAACGILLVLLSALTYRFVEHPFLGPSRAAKKKPDQSPSTGRHTPLASETTSRWSA